MQDIKKCPFCAEEIRAEALRCPHCRSRLGGFAAERWHRDHPQARMAGVAAGVAAAFQVPVALVRVGFVALTFLHLLGPVLYGLLWLVMPPSPEHPSLAEEATAGLGSALAGRRCRHARRRCPHCGEPLAEGDDPGDFDRSSPCTAGPS